MADNITAPATGAVLATDDVGGVQYPRTKLSIGADGAAADVHSGNPLPVGGVSAVVSASFSRPANTTAYSIGDLVANSTTAASVTPMSLAVARVAGGTGSILRCRVSSTKVGAGTDIFRVHLFTTSPTAANGDNVAFSVNGRAAGWIGTFEVTLDRVFNDGTKGIAGPLNGGQVVFAAAGGDTNVYALIEIRTAYTPASGETYTVELEVSRD